MQLKREERPPWFLDCRRSGGLFLDLLIHGIDQVEWGAGLWAGFAHDPLVVYDSTMAAVDPLVEIARTYLAGKSSRANLPHVLVVTDAAPCRRGIGMTPSPRATVQNASVSPPATKKSPALQSEWLTVWSMAP